MQDSFTSERCYSGVFFFLAFYIGYTLWGFCFILGSDRLISLKIISWSPIGGNVSILFMKDGFDIHRRSRVRSFLVGLSMTCVRLWSFNISSKFWCRDWSGLLGTECTIVVHVLLSFMCCCRSCAIVVHVLLLFMVCWDLQSIAC